MVKVKVCGITNLKDALAAEKAGADIIGFIFARSPRRLKPAAAKKIIRGLKLSTMKAGVFVNESPDRVHAVAGDLKLNIVQLHGDENREYIKKIKNVKIIKAVRVKNVRDVKRAVKLYSRRVFALLFDTFSAKARGGTGRAFNWKILRRVKAPYFLAGGLNADNAKKAKKLLRPYGFDVNSGIESRPGKKDLKKMKSFFSAIRG